MKRRAFRRLISAFVATAMILGCIAVATPSAVGAEDGELRGSTAEDFVYLMRGQEATSAYVAPPEDGYLRAQAATITVEYNGFTPEARAAFQYAVGIWQGFLVSPVPIAVVAYWQPLSENILGGTKPVNWRKNFSGAPEQDYWYPLALANKLGGRDFDPGVSDIEITFNSALPEWYFGTGQTPAGRANFASTVLHELAHGLGFGGTARVSGNLGYLGRSGYADIYDGYVVNGSGQYILDFPNASTALAAQLLGNNLWFTGRAARSANGGNAPRLFAPSRWYQGTSYSHLDEYTYPPGSLNSLMTPVLDPGETVYNPGPIALGILTDLGWTIASAPPTPVYGTRMEPTALDFGNVPVGTTSASRQVQLTNTGNTTLLWNGSNGFGPRGNGFITTDENCTRSDWESGATCSLMVAFRPVVAGAANDTWSVLDPDGKTMATLTMSGVGVGAGPQPSPQPSPSTPGGGQRCFPETGQCISGRFLAQWESHGGLAINGYPLSAERQEKLEDGKTYLVQWFERVRMEYHPENTAPNDVLLGQFGRAIHPADPPVAEIPGQNFFPQTGHNVPNDFMAYWNANGGLPQFGFPLSEVITETLEDGKPYQVIYFERARFERHPENVAPYNVLLGQFGRRILNGLPGPNPSPSPVGNVIFQDDFTNPNSGWPVGKHPQGHYESSYLPGEYRIALAAANYYAILTNRNIAPQANVRLEADMTRFGPVQEPLFGFACRAYDLDNYYGAVIATDGYALLFKFTGGRYVEFGRVQNHPAIKRGNATNRVRFDCVGTQLTLYVNGTPILSAQDGEFGGGQQGFLVYSFDKGGLDLHIRNFIAYRP